MNQRAVNPILPELAVFPARWPIPQCALAACLLAVNLTAVAQELSPAKPESVGLSSERLERIGAAVQRSIDDKHIAGAVTLVADVVMSPG